MEIKELIERSIGDLKVKLLLYKTALVDAKDPELQVKLKRFITNTEFEIGLLEHEKLLRAAKDECANVTDTEFEIKLLEQKKRLIAAKEKLENVREQKRNSKSK